VRHLGQIGEAQVGRVLAAQRPKHHRRAQIRRPQVVQVHTAAALLLMSLAGSGPTSQRLESPMMTTSQVV
jgi:hypothetical protein